MMNVQSIAAIPVEESAYFTEAKQVHVNDTYQSSKKEIYNNEAIVNGLKIRDVSIIKFVYKQYFLPIKYMVTSNSGKDMDAEDVFQDALVVIYKKISSGNLNLTSAFHTYLYAICKHIWLQKLNKKGIQLEYKEISDFDSADDSQGLELMMADNEKYRLFQKHFSMLSEDDQNVLRLYLKKVPLSEIATIMGFSSYDYAKVRKYIVKEKLKNSILNDPEYREMLMSASD